MLLLLADTIAAHQLGGYKIPGGAFRKCRDCNATQTLMDSKVYPLPLFINLTSTHNQFRETDYNLRTPSSYDRDCARLEKGPMPEHDSVTCGIKSRNFFHVADSQLPQDIMPCFV